MKEHQDDVMPGLRKSVLAVGSIAADEILTQRLGVSEDGVLAEGDEGEDMMVDVVGADAVAHDHGRTGVNFDRKLNSDGLDMEEETETHDKNMEQVVVSGEGICDAFVGSRVLTSEKVKVVVNEEGLKTSVKVSKDVLQGNAVNTVPSLSNGDAHSSGTWVREPQSVGGQNAVIDRKEERERGSNEEVVEQPTEFGQEVADGNGMVDQKTGKGVKALDSSKISEPSTTANPGSEDVNVVVLEKGLASKDEAQDGVAVDPSFVCLDDRSLSVGVVNSATLGGDVNLRFENLDRQAEVDKLSQKESLRPTIEVVTNDAQHGTGLRDSKLAVELSSGKPHFGEESAVIDWEERARGLTEDEETVEQPTESVQEVADGDFVLDEKTGKEDLSMTPISSTTINLDSVDLHVVVLEEGLSRKNKVQDSNCMVPSFVAPDNRSLSTEVVNAGTGEGAVHLNSENSNQQAETDQMSKDDSLHPTIEAISSDASQGCLHHIVEQQVGTVKPNENGLESQTSLGGRSVSSLDPSKPFAGGGMEQIKHKVSKQSTLEAFNEHHRSVIGGDGAMIACAPCVSSISHIEVATTTDSKVSDLDSVQHFSVGGEVLTIDNKVCDSVKNIDDVEIEGSKFQTMNESSKTEAADGAEHCVRREDSEFSYDEAHMERGEDAGMDIDEVLGWKDEMPGIDGLSGSVGCLGKDQHLKVNANSEDDVEELSESSCEPVLIGQRDENFKFREPIVYERRVHVEVPLYNALDGSDSPQLEDENLKVETDSEEDDGSVQEEEDKVVGISTNLARGFEMVNEDPSTLAPLDAVCGGSHWLEAHVNEAEDSSVADKDYQSLPLVEDKSKVVKNNACLHARLDEKGDNEFTEVGSLMGKEVDVKEHSGRREQTDYCRDQKTEALEHGSEAEQSSGIDEVSEHFENGNSFSLHQSCYFQPPENKGQFSVSDLVWGKVRSHPWWPGQIFDPSDASEKAMKYHKKDCFLVAYFGDRSFAWNDPAVLKPFREKFSQIEKQTNSEAFKNAVSCALEEVSRRVELGLTCSCVPQDNKKIEYQVLENGGIRQESTRRYGTEESAGVSSFEPDKLVDYVRLLAQFPGESDKMELAIAKAQLSSYGCYKGHRKLPEFQFCGDMLEDAITLCEGVELVNKDGEQISERSDIRGEYIASYKFEDNLMDSAYPNKKRSLSDLNDDVPYSGDGEDGVNITGNLVSLSGFKKRKALDSISDASEKRPNLHSEELSTALTPTPKPSFKVGECIQRVASQLTGPPSVLKSSSDRKVEHGRHADQLGIFAGTVQGPEYSQRGRMIVEGNQTSAAEMLSQLHLTAQDPMKGYSFLNTIMPFFYSHRAAFFIKSIRRNSSTGKPIDARKRKIPNENDPEEYEFDDVNDSYWTDRIIQNYSEEQLLQDNQNGGVEYQVVALEPDKPAKVSRRSNKKRFFSTSNEIEAKEQLELVGWRQQNLATEVVLKFTKGIYFPSEIHLNKMFRRFGPLMESETEVDRQSGRARVVFKKCSDAEVAHSSAGMFNIFGSINVNYELNYTPLVSYKPLPLPMLQDPMDAC